MLMHLFLNRRINLWLNAEPLKLSYSSHTTLPLLITNPLDDMKLYPKDVEYLVYAHKHALFHPNQVVVERETA